MQSTIFIHVALIVETASYLTRSIITDRAAWMDQMLG